MTLNSPSPNLAGHLNSVTIPMDESTCSKPDSLTHIISLKILNHRLLSSFSKQTKKKLRSREKSDSHVPEIWKTLKKMFIKHMAQNQQLLRGKVRIGTQVFLLFHQCLHTQFYLCVLIHAAPRMLSPLSLQVKL